MAGCINQANVKFSNLFRQGSGVYRDLAQDQDPDQIGDSHEISVELKSSAEGEEEVVRSFSQNLQKSPKRKWSNLAKITVLVIFVFIAGYLVGYVTVPKPRISMNTATAVTTVDTVDTEPSEDIYYKPAQPFADWSSVVEALGENLKPAAMDKTLQEISSQDLQAGSDGEHALAQKVLEKFKAFGMDHWKDVHYVKLQVPSGENKVLMGSDVVGSPKGYLAYSATGTKQGKVVYANYGRREDLENFKNQGINLEEKIALMRAGKISLAEKVENAAQVGLAAVLIYQDTSNERELNTELYGQVHLGTGDPYTPGFPSFNHTQFPPSESSGLPKILAQSITAETARKIHLNMKGKDAPSDFSGTLPGVSKYTLGGETNVTVTVNNVLVDTEIHNAFGIIKGFIDPDRYVVLGAQRDAFGGGFAKSTVGTSLLVELARAVTDMLKAGFKPRRSIVFASWSAGDFGSVGATEWLEGYLSSLNLRAFTYISLDATVSGVKQFKASSSPLLYKLLKNTMKEVKSPRNMLLTLSQDFASSDWTKSVLEPMRVEDGAYPFLASSGIPSISFRFVSDSETSDYKYFGTFLDTRESLNQATEGKLLNVCVTAAQIAGRMALRLVHDHILNLDVSEYNKVIMSNVLKITKEIRKVEALGVNSSSVLKDKWLYSAVGSFSRAVSALNSDNINSDLDDAVTCRNINDRIMRVEHNLLSPYVSPRDVPFRHIIFGSGDYSVSSLLTHLSALKQQAVGSDADLFRNQFALITWTIQSCANDLKGNIQGLDN
ncbi:transferrin receptor 1b [Tachysurus fulvidraco]|uniref:transferrin receptor 1b n=1 Tax=Tachysurus fulvidraco TaxID=1234273 RepID=UPI001FEDDFE4|nr:transferrin receptor 1b [Tachysurus fulvidraco]XP_027029549.2 transferrin receptor 1b [Tachysurus fulvidraco]